jgi:hypothetical protein
MARRVSSLNPKLPFNDEGGLHVLHAECVRAVKWWNVRYWNGDLPEPIVTFQPNGPRSMRLGHYQAKTWKGAAGEVRDELVLYSDLCLSRGIEQVCQTIVHELVHVWEQHSGKPPHSNHHGRRWHAEAKRVGLETEGPKGFTKPTPQFKADLHAFAPKAIAPSRRVGIRRGTGKLRKWVCRCGFGVRVAVPYFNAECRDCGQRFKLVK